jgi:tetratricopeptide (TPR) repeat protein
MQQTTFGQQDSLLITIISNLNAQSNQEAIKLIDQTLLNDPTLVALHYPRALALGRLGRVDDAVRSLEILTALDPKAATVKALQGEFNSAKASSANKPTDNARASREHEVNSLLDQALEKLNKADPATALNLLIEAKALKIAVRDLDYVRAMCFIELGRVAEARESLREELRHFPDNSIAQELLAQVLEQDQSGQQQETQLVELSNPEFQELLKTIRPYTMVPTVRLYSLYHLAQQVCQLGITGNLCRVWSGWRWIICIARKYD